MTPENRLLTSRRVVGRTLSALLLVALFAPQFPTMSRAQQPLPLHNDRTSAAQSVLKRYCSSCHTSVANTKSSKSTGLPRLPDVSDIEGLARDRRFVQPGLADASALYSAMASRSMPPTGTAGGPVDTLPNGADIAKVRDWIEGLPADNAPHSPSAIATVGDHRDDGKGFELRVTPDHRRRGQAVTLEARSGAACYLTLINVEPDGVATVLFPNDFQRDNLVAAGGVVTVPPKAEPFTLRLDQPGPERFVAICSASQAPVDGIRHDFDRQRFTVLGDWSQYLLRSLGQDAVKRRSAAQSSTVRRRIRRRGRVFWRTVRRRSQPIRDSGPVAQIRTAVEVEVLP